VAITVGFPPPLLSEYLPIEDAIRRGRFVGLPSYHMVDNPVYRDALPFGDHDLEMVRQYGLATVARVRTIGGSPARRKRVTMPEETGFTLTSPTKRITIH
jgi:hypothetical protein